MTRQAVAVAAMAAVAAVVMSGCGPPASHSSAPPTPVRHHHHPATATPTPATQTPSASVTPSPTKAPTPTQSSSPRFDTWVVGAHPLPLGPDGFGQVLPTPPQLRVRLLRTVDVLPPPTDTVFHFTVRRMTAAKARAIDLAWKPGCPVALSDLDYLTLSFIGFDGARHTGAMVVNRSVAGDVVEVFRRLYAARFPLEQMTPATNAGLDAPPTGDGNETSGYACRPVVGQTSGWSAHAYGLAVDVNPFDNPYIKGDLVIPELASAYLDRSWRRPGMIFSDGPVVRAFTSVGWTWGGTFHSVKDLHHFSANGQ